MDHTGYPAEIPETNHERTPLPSSPKNKNAGLVGPATSLSLICGERLVYVFVPADLF